MESRLKVALFVSHSSIFIEFLDIGTFEKLHEFAISYKFLSNGKSFLKTKSKMKFMFHVLEYFSD